MSSFHLFLLIVLGLTASTATVARATVTDQPASNVYFDQFSNVNMATVIPPNSASAPVSGLGNVQLGMTVNLENWTNNVSRVSGLDVTVSNSSGSAITARPLRLNVWIWQTVNSQNFGTSAQIFSNQLDVGLGAGRPTAVLNLGPLSLANNSVSPLSFVFPNSFTMNLSFRTEMGISFNWQVDQGSGFADLPGLTTGITSGFSTLPPVVGSNMISSPNGGYLRSVNNADVNGNFRGDSVRSVGFSSAAPFALYVPTPATIMPIAGFLFLTRRRPR